MRTRIDQIEPVIIMLDTVAAASGPLSFSGIDLDDGSHVSVTVSRPPDGLAHQTSAATHTPSETLVLVLSIERISAH